MWITEAVRTLGFEAGVEHFTTPMNALSHMVECEPSDLSYHFDKIIACKTYKTIPGKPYKETTYAHVLDKGAEYIIIYTERSDFTVSYEKHPLVEASNAIT